MVAYQTFMKIVWAVYQPFIITQVYLFSLQRNFQLVSFLLQLSSEAIVRVVLGMGVIRNFTKFTGKHMCQSLFCNKVAGLRSTTLLKKRLWHSVFLWILRNF